MFGCLPGPAHGHVRSFTRCPERKRRPLQVEQARHFSSRREKVWDETSPKTPAKENNRTCYSRRRSLPARCAESAGGFARTCENRRGFSARTGGMFSHVLKNVRRRKRAKTCENVRKRAKTKTFAKTCHADGTQREGGPAWPTLTWLRPDGAPARWYRRSIDQRTPSVPGRRFQEERRFQRREGFQRRDDSRGEKKAIRGESKAIRGDHSGCGDGGAGAG